MRSVFRSPDPPIHDGQVVLDGPWMDAQVVEGVAAVRARHLAPVEQRSQRRCGLRQPVESLAEAAPEVDAERLVLELEPGTADACDGPAAADVVDGRDALGGEPGIPERVGTDEEPQSRAFRRLGDRGERRVPLEDGLVRITEDGVDVVPGPQVVEPELVGPHRRIEEARPVAGLTPQVQPELDIRHPTTSLDCVEPEGSTHVGIRLHAPEVRGAQGGRCRGRVPHFRRRASAGLVIGVVTRAPAAALRPDQ